MDPTFDFADARNRMVDSQVRPNKVTDPRIIAAMREIPPRISCPSASPVRYIDEDIPLGDGRVLMEPMVIARLVQLLAPTEAERALVIAAGPGYGAALLAACGVRVTALEEDRRLIEPRRTGAGIGCAVGPPGVRPARGWLAARGAVRHDPAGRRSAATPADA